MTLIPLLVINGDFCLRYGLGLVPVVVLYGLGLPSGLLYGLGLPSVFRSGYYTGLGLLSAFRSKYYTGFRLVLS